MPNAVNSAQTSSAPGAGGSSLTATGANPQAPEYRFAAGPDVPAWAVGKSAREVLDMSKQMADALAAVPVVGNRTAAPGAQPAAAAQQVAALTLPSNDDFTLDPVAATQRTLEYNYAQRMQPLIAQLQGNVALTSRGLVAQQHKADFDRWGPEIDQLVVNVPPEQRSVELYGQALKLVRANHIDDIVAERAQARMAELGVTDRTGGGGTLASATVATVSLDKLNPAYKAALDRVGIGQGELNEFLAKTGQTLEQFVESANRRQVVTDATYEGKKSQVQVGFKEMYGPTVKVKEW